MHDLEDTLRRHVAKAAKVDPGLLGPTTDLVRDLGFSSLELLNLLALAEKQYGVTIPDRELVTLTTIQRIANKVRELAEPADNRRESASEREREPERR